MADASLTYRHIYVTGLKNAHAVEHQALALLDRQIERLQNYDELEARMRDHRRETEEQISRLDNLLSDIGESHSAIKDLGLTLSGNMAALAHTVAGDEILKNSFASFAFENFEAASYRSLIVMAEEAGFANAVPLLQQTLKEEISMAAFVEENLPLVTRRFLALSAAGEQASH